MTDEEKFWSKVVKSEGCWEWQGAKRSNGYGVIYKKGKSTQAHRFSWMITSGAIPEGMYVCHKCDNRPCVRPDHLFLGTHTDNMRDCGAKGRICTIGKSRLTHCKYGHPFAGNTRIRPDGSRQCKICTYNECRSRRERIRNELAGMMK